MSSTIPESVRSFLDQLEARGLKCVQNEGPDEKFFGNRVIEYSGREIRVRIVLDQSQWLVSLGAPARPGDEFYVGLLGEFVRGRAVDDEPLDDQLSFVDSAWKKLVDVLAETGRDEKQRERLLLLADRQHLRSVGDVLRPGRIEKMKELLGGLDSASTRGYGALRIPVSRDDEIAALVIEWIALAPRERESAGSSSWCGHSPVLLAFSERVASRAVREASRELVLLGLVAQGLDGLDADSRENQVVLAPLFDACRQLGADPTPLFERAAAFVPPTAAAGVKAFPQRRPEDQSLEAMGYRRSKDADGFRYLRRW